MEGSGGHVRIAGSGSALPLLLLLLLLSCIPGQSYHWLILRCRLPSPPGLQGLVPGTKDFAGPSVEAQTEQVMANLGAILAAAGSDWSKVVKTTILLVRAWVGGWLGGRVGGWGWGAALGWPGLGWVLSSAAPIGRALGLMQG